MNNIKFRGKIKNSETGYYELDYVFGDLVRALKTGKVFICDLSDFNQETKLKDVLMEIEPKTVGRYSGIKAKNDIEIYGGDIIRIENQNEEFGDFAVYEYGNILCVDCGYFCGLDYEIVPLDFFSHGNDYQSLEVVGNAYKKFK